MTTAPVTSGRALYRAVVAALAFVGGRALTMEPGGQADVLMSRETASPRGSALDPGLPA
jgi:hypothetical protein